MKQRNLQAFPIAMTTAYVGDTAETASWGTITTLGGWKSETLPSTLSGRVASTEYFISGFQFEKKQTLGERETELAEKLRNLMLAKLEKEKALHLKAVRQWLKALDTATTIALFLIPIGGIIGNLAKGAVEAAVKELAGLAVEALLSELMGSESQATGFGDAMKDQINEQAQGLFVKLGKKYIQAGPSRKKVMIWVGKKGVEKAASFVLDKITGDKDATELLYFGIGGKGLLAAAVYPACPALGAYLTAMQVQTFQQYLTYLRLDKDYVACQRELAAATAFRIQVDPDFRATSAGISALLAKANGIAPTLSSSFVLAGEPALIENFALGEADLLILRNKSTGVWKAAAGVDYAMNGLQFLAPEESGTYDLFAAKQSQICVVMKDPPGTQLFGLTLTVTPKLLLPEKKPVIDYKPFRLQRDY